jgi:hypothetical protein
MAIKISNSTIIDDDRSIVNASKAGIGTTNPSNTLSVIGDVGIGTVIDIIPYDTLNNGTLSFEASEGQLFSITNNLTSGSIFSVNDVSGIPSIDVDADGSIDIAPYGGVVNVGGITFFNGERVYNQDVTVDNNKINVSLESDIVIEDGKTLTVSEGSTIVLNPFDFEKSAVDELLVNKSLTVGFSSSFEVVTSGIASVAANSTSLIGFGEVVPPNIETGLLVKEIPGVIAAGTTVVSFTSGSPTGKSTITISPASLNTSVQEDVIFKFGNFGEKKSGIILDGETGLIKSSSNTILIDGEENKITINDMVLDASEDGTLAVSYNDNLRFRAGNDGYFRLGTSLSGGIQFNGDTAAVNALDNYEEGTWTPTVNGWTSVTYSLRSGKYTKIGNTVTAWFALQFSGTSAGTAAIISGLPFTVVGDSQGGAMTYHNAPTNETTGILPFPSGTNIDMYADNDGGATISANGNATNKYFIGSVTYAA